MRMLLLMQNPAWPEVPCTPGNSGSTLRSCRNVSSNSSSTACPQGTTVLTENVGLRNMRFPLGGITISIC